MDFLVTLLFGLLFIMPFLIWGEAISRKSWRLFFVGLIVIFPFWGTIIFLAMWFGVKMGSQ